MVRIGCRFVRQPVTGVQRDQSQWTIIKPVVPPFVLWVGRPIVRHFEVREKLVCCQICSCRFVSSTWATIILMIAQRGHYGNAAGQCTVSPGIVTPELVPVSLFATGLDKITNQQNQVGLSFGHQVAISDVTSGLVDEIVLDTVRTITPGRYWPRDRICGR